MEHIIHQREKYFLFIINLRLGKCYTTLKFFLLLSEKEVWTGIRTQEFLIYKVNALPIRLLKTDNLVVTSNSDKLSGLIFFIPLSCLHEKTDALPIRLSE